MRPLDPFDRKAMGLSVGLHTGLFVLVWLSTLQGGSDIEFIAYEIELVSPPPAVQAEEPQVATEELVVQTPEPEPAPPEPEEEEEEVVPIEEPTPDPPPEPEPAAEPPPDPDEVEVVAAAPDPPPEEEPEVSGDGINVRLEGLRRDYPEYYANIIRQIQRCFRPPRDGGNWLTTIGFTIGRDGQASDIDFDTRSGNTAFDFQAMGAVDCAGQGRFGALPEDYPWESLPMLFDFTPSGGFRELLPTTGPRVG